MSYEVRVAGYRELMVALREVPKAERKEIREEFRRLGRLVADDADRRITGLQPSGGKSADYRTYVRQRGVSVEQPLRKTTGKRPDWGVTQMDRGLVPALEENSEEVVVGLEAALERAIVVAGL